jgi:hypothetical protein
MFGVVAVAVPPPVAATGAGAGAGTGAGAGAGAGAGKRRKKEEEEEELAPQKDCNGFSLTELFGCTSATFGQFFPWARVKPWTFSVSQTGTARAHSCEGQLDAHDTNNACRPCRDVVNIPDLVRAGELAKVNLLLAWRGTVP